MGIFDNPFASAETVRLYLDDEHTHWIDVRVSLTVEEEQRINTAGFRGYAYQKAEEGSADDDGTTRAKVDIDWHRVKVERIRTYVKAWSFGKPVSDVTIRSLRSDVAEAIEDAITKWKDDQDPKKKALSTAPISEPSPPSVAT